MTQLNANLLTAINKYATSKEEPRYYLNGVCLDIGEDGTAFMVATDGWKLLAAPFKNDSIPSGHYIIPRQLIENIKVLKNDKSNVSIKIDGNDVSLEHKSAIFSGKLIDGTFPDWRRVIPAEQNGEPARFRGAYLKDLEDAAKMVGTSAPLVGFNGWNPSWVEFPGSVLFGVIMPEIKGNSPDPKKPNISR